MTLNQVTQTDDACWFPTYKFMDINVSIDEEEKNEEEG